VFSNYDCEVPCSARYNDLELKFRSSYIYDLKNRNGGKEGTGCIRRERRSGKGVGEKELAGKNLLERKSGKEVCGNGVGGKQRAGNNWQKRTSEKEFAGTISRKLLSEK
jgi:hypothetical protein